MSPITVVLLIILTAALLLFGLWLVMTAPRRSHPQLLEELVRWDYAHRGLHGKAVPENSLPAFQKALEHGFGAELDVRLTKDEELVVMHDDSLGRMCGAEEAISARTLSELSAFRLAGTKERIPRFHEVLELVAGRTPLIVEIKTVRGNHNRIASAVAEALKNYTGPYCVESFDPRALLWFRKHCPLVVRGQLSGNLQNANVSRPLKMLLRMLWGNVLSRPDFVAYAFADRGDFSLRLARAVWNMPVFLWTIVSLPQQKEAKRLGAVSIFEQFGPGV